MKGLGESVNRVTASRAIVSALKLEGVRHVFGMAGSSILDILDVIYDEKEIRFVDARHEFAAAFMAEGYARASGEVGVCLVTGGPGATNIVTGVASAFASNTPLLAITGSTSRTYIGRKSFQELDQVSIFKPITKWNAQILQAQRIPDTFRHAFRQALSYPRGPVHIDIPRDVLFEEFEFTPMGLESYHVEDLLEAASPAIVQAAKVLFHAEAPFLIVGDGVVATEASAEALRLAEMLSMPVATSYGHVDAVPSSHHLFVGQLGRAGSKAAKELAQESDVILAVGTGLGHFTTYYGYEYIPEKARIIQVHVDPAELGRNYALEVGIVGGAKSVLTQLTSALEELGPIPSKSEWVEKTKETKRRRVQEMSGPSSTENGSIKPRAVFQELREIMTRDMIITVDAGTACALCYDQLEFFEPRTFIAPLDLASIGFAFPAGLGAKLARPEKTVISICGDGGFLMTIQDLETAIRLNIPTLVLVLNNFALGSEKAYQKTYYDGRYIGADIKCPDFAKVAEVFGGRGMRVEKPSELRPTIRDALKKLDVVTVVDVFIDREEYTPPARPDVMRKRSRRAQNE